MIEKDELFLTILPNGLISAGILGNGANFKILSKQMLKTHLHFHDRVRRSEHASLFWLKINKEITFGCGIQNNSSQGKKHIGLLLVNPELLTARYIANIIDFPNALSVGAFLPMVG